MAAAKSHSDSKLPIARPKRATRRWCVTVVGNWTCNWAFSAASSPAQWQRPRKWLCTWICARAPHRTTKLEIILLGFWPRKEKPQYLLAPRSNYGITPVGLLGRYKDTSSPPFIAPSVAAELIEHPRTAGHLGSRRICLSVFVPLITAILQGSVKKKSALFWALLRC